MSKTNTSSLPSHRIYAVTKNGKAKYWTAIGAAWPHSDGEGFFLKLDYLPLNGAQLVIRKPKAEEAAPAPEAELPLESETA
jgi:hypothetical protein